MALTSKKKVRLLNLLYQSHGPHCFYCGRDMLPLRLLTEVNRTPLPDNYPTIEHLIPQIVGGGNVIANLRVACPPCNGDKGHSLHLDLSKFSRAELEESLLDAHNKNIALIAEAKTLRRSIQVLSNKISKMKEAFNHG